MSLFPLFPLFPYFYNLSEKSFWLGFYESAGTARTAGTVIFYKLPPRRAFGRSICKKLPIALHLNSNISTKTIKCAIYE
jgi:hypothetical protein